ncbi:MAG: recombinase family protein [Ruthenibacterium sp.]
MQTITVIPASLHRFSAVPLSAAKRKRVAGYARVSTDQDEQLTSYEAQVDYYTKYIQKNDDWDFVEVYTDEGISATTTKHRDGFNRMISDALAGKIDLIITKSVSRFARNTVDSLTTVRKLKEKGVEVYFEKENIFTLDSKGELLITIMSSLAQEESRSISENVTWGQRKRFADGKVSLPYAHFLGYDRGADGLPAVNEEEAVTVRLIYRLFLEGKTPHGIAKQLTADGIPTPSGKENWQPGTIRSILTNEKYKGDALLQKRYTVDFLTKKKKVNEGEIQQYYVKNSHAAIVKAEVFEMVQQEMKRRKQMPTRHSGTDIFASRIVCGECGATYGAKVWHSTDKYRKVVYQCDGKFKGDTKCHTPHFDEETIKKRFVAALNKLIAGRADIFDNFAEIDDAVFATDALDQEIAALQSEMSVAAELVQKYVEENARSKVNQEEYRARYADLLHRFETAKTRFAALTEQRKDKETRRETTQTFLAALHLQNDFVTEFDARLWHTLLDFVTVYTETDVRFTFKDGTEINA